LFRCLLSPFWGENVHLVAKNVCRSLRKICTSHWHLGSFDTCGKLAVGRVCVLVAWLGRASVCHCRGNFDQKRKKQTNKKAHEGVTAPHLVPTSCVLLLSNGSNRNEESMVGGGGGIHVRIFELNQLMSLLKIRKLIYIYITYTCVCVGCVCVRLADHYIHVESTSKKTKTIMRHTNKWDTEHNQT
jgi:hypothetical protein